MPDTHGTIERIAAYLEALAADPDAPPPPELTDDDLAWLRGLVRAHAIPALDRLQRDRVWRRALAAALAQRLDEPRLAGAHPPARNGRFDDAQEEPMTVNTQPRTFPPLARPQREPKRGLWTLIAAAAACVLLAAGVFFVSGRGTGPAPAGAPDSAGAGLAQVGSPTPTLAATPLEEVRATPTSVPVEPTGTPIVLPRVDVVTVTPVPQPLEFGIATVIPTVFPGMGYAPVEQVISPYAADLALVEVLRLAQTALDDLVWSPDGRWLALAAGTDIRLHRAAALDGAPLLLEGHTAPVQALAINPYSELLASGDEEGNVLLWNTTTGALLQTLEVGGGSVSRLAFSPWGSTLIVASEDGAVRLFTLP